ncbi:BNR repeat-containing protein [Erythrobacter sp.]|uniref:BNR repeat-containing protein n=1 Tax=Erythrobacter sp. TaxID=1042 RepID=UPI0025E9AA11|nr:BNR repeat-containing protein [Erythrobacter sp.]
MTMRDFGVGGLMASAMLLAIPIAVQAKESDRQPDAVLAPDHSVEAIDFTWSGHRAHPQMIQRGQHQIIVYYDANRQMSVAHRSTPRTPWRYHKLPSFLGWDSHNYVTVDVDEEGYVHVMGNMHADPLVYFRSTRPWDIRSLEQIDYLIDPAKELRVTYPRFDHDPQGRLIAAFRIGGSGNGSFTFHRFDTGSKTWSLLHGAAFFDGEGERSAYYIGPDRGPDGRFHMVWVWRDTPSAATNNNVSYARSPDLLTWEDSNGKPLSLPITLANGEIVDPVPVGAGLLNGHQRLGFDAAGAPMISYFKNDANGDTQIMLARKSGDSWTVQQISDWTGIKQDLDRGGSLPGNALSVREGPFVAADGTIRVRATLRSKPIEFIVDPVSGKTTGTGTFSSAPAVISGYKDIPGIPLNVRKAEGAPADSAYDYYLSWQAENANQDQARPDIPPPSTLRLHKIKR